ncbi:MAG TPA: KpsF/GutQ family sugar-phosphate isomerase [Candidatus Eisenbacteria bacterium]
MTDARKAAPAPDQTAQVIEWGREVLAHEGEALEALKDRVDKDFARAVRVLLEVKGQVLTSGVGKSGLVAKKIAATLTSTGTPATFVHPVDAVHGDLGIVSNRDAAILLSKSGETVELLELLPAFRRHGVPVIAMTCDAASSLAREADAVVDLGNPREACPDDLVPTSSTTAALAMGDALAVALMRLKGFTRDDFAVLHPGGVLGQTATVRVEERMRRGEDLPRVSAGATLHEALLEILKKRVGMTTVLDEAGRLCGVLTDGDLKRILLKGAFDPAQPVSEVMSRTPKTIEAGAMIAQAVRRMEENAGGAITSLVVLGADGAPAGVIHLHDCLGARPR